MLNLDDLRTLPAEQKLAIVTRLWNDLASSTPPLSLPFEEIAEMDRRRAEMFSDPIIAIDASEVWRRVDGN